MAEQLIRAASARDRNIWYAAAFVEATAFGFVIPMLPFRILGLGGTAVSVGAAAATYGVAVFLGNILLGRLSDRAPRSRIIQASLAVGAISYAGLAFVPSIEAIVLCRAASGLGAARTAVLRAQLTDDVPAEAHTSLLARLGAAAAAGALLGPLCVAGLAASLPPGTDILRILCVLAAVAQLLLTVAAGRVRRAPDPVDDPETHAIPPGIPADLRTVLAVAATAAYGFTTLTSTGPLLANLRLGWGPAPLGLLMAAAAVTFVGSQLRLAPLLVSRLGDGRAYVLAIGISAAGLISTGFATHAVAFCLSFLIACTGIAVGNILTTTFVSVRASVSQRGRLFGTLSAIGSVAGAGGAAAGGFLFGAGTSWSPNLVAGLLVAISGVAALRGGPARA